MRAALRQVLLSRPRQSARQIISRLGLDTSLVLCLDAGDSLSAPPGATSWLDRSGTGYDFLRGTSGGADSTDPTFNGSPGALTGNEYYSTDGGDFFRYDTTNETWMQNMHKDNSVLSALFWVYMAAPADDAFMGNSGATGTNVGFRLLCNASAQLSTSVFNGSGVNVMATNMTAVIPTAQWCLVSFAMDESVGAGGVTYGINDAFETATSTITSPSASNANFTTELFAGGNGSSPCGSGTRFGMVNIWSGRRLTAAEIATFYNATRKRFGV